MKNIHVQPTDKPSRLHLWTDENGTRLETCKLEYSHTRNTQNIYITSDEEIKEGDWFYHPNKALTSQIIKATEFTKNQGVIIINGFNGYVCKKIILTTDQDLIADGVQAIDDDFLEWFVQNPSCERVEVMKKMYMPQSNGKISDGKITHELSLDPSQNTLPYYEIIIPQDKELCHYSGLPSPSAYIENHKQATGKYFADNADLIITVKREETLEEAKQYPIAGYAPGNYMCYCSTCDIKFQGDKRAVQCEPCAIKTVDEAKQRAKNSMALKGALDVKEETLEEAAEKEFPLIDTEWCKTGAAEEENLQLLGHRKSFIEGAKWQAKRMYSEEQVKHIVSEALQSALVTVNLDGWFEQFKNK